MSARELLAAAAALGRVQGFDELCAEIARLGVTLSGARAAVVSIPKDDGELTPRVLATRGDAGPATRSIDALPRGGPWRALTIEDEFGVAARLHLRYDDAIDDSRGDSRDDSRDDAPAPARVRAVIPHMAAALRNASTYAQLEELVEREMRSAVTREQAIQLILDSMQEGLLVCDLQGALVGTRSRAILEWFGSSEAFDRIWTYIAGEDGELALTLQLGFEQLFDGALPFDVAADQLPRTITRDDRSFELEYRPVFESGRYAGVLLLVQDVTARVSAQQAERRARELPAILRHLARSPGGFHDFLEETARLLRSLTREDGRATLRALHTLKGNAALYGFDSFARRVHATEERAELGTLTDAELRALAGAWRRERLRLDAFLGRDEERLRLSHAEHEAFVEQLVEGGVAASLVERARSWRRPRVGDTFDRLAAVTSRLAARVGKAIDVHVDGAHERVPPGDFRPFLGALVHAVRNAIDHGIEPPHERVAAGKPERASIWLRARQEHGRFVVSVRDDGRGINWDQVTRNAARVGVDARVDPVGALCVGSTAASVTELSGRGVGVSALCEATKSLGGTITVESEAGVGTLLRFEFPRPQ
ncbi:MAG: Hpt domain-containing protein [Myxococcales bacterium]|nr:Hpt domain-containing protein [Myxococcales bacterium]